MDADFKAAHNMIPLQHIAEAIDKGFKNKSVKNFKEILESKTFQKEGLALLEYTPALIGNWLNTLDHCRKNLN